APGRPPAQRAGRGSREGPVTRADLRTSASAGWRRASVVGLAATVTAATPRPTDTPPSDFALLMAARHATAVSKQPGSCGAGTVARSSAPGQGARWIVGCP